MNTRTQRKTLTGKVVSNKMNKTITVSVERRFRHPLYGKYITKTTKVMAHDAEDACGIGDLVSIMETRPISKQKSWRLVQIIEKAV
jgi:small subunit ribosomal protein S17